MGSFDLSKESAKADLEEVFHAKIEKMTPGGIVELNLEYSEFSRNHLYGYHASRIHAALKYWRKEELRVMEFEIREEV